MMSVAAPAEAAPVLSGLKRSRSVAAFDEPSSYSPSQSPATKRAKVQFGENQLRYFEKSDGEDPASLVKEKVRRALEQHRNGNSTEYNAIREQLIRSPKYKDAPSSSLLKKYMNAITSQCSIMDRRCTTLVDAILDMRWLGRDEEFIFLYRRLLANLISTYGGYTEDVFASLVDMFMSLRPHHGRLGVLPTVKRSTMLDRLHGTIRYLVEKLPSAQKTLKSVVQETFPYAGDSMREHVDYVNNILRVASYIPGLRTDIVSLIVDKVSSIDVQTQVDISNLEDDLENHLKQDLTQEVAAIVQMPREDLPPQAELLTDSDSEEPEPKFESPIEQRLHTLKLEVAKIDGIMDMLFAYFAPVFRDSPVDEQKRIFESLLGMFIRTMLPTFKSRHIQFLIFHFAQESEHLSQRFIQTLTDVIMDRNQPTMFRRSAASYLGSFLSRGLKVPRNLVQDSFYTMAKELDRLRHLHERNDKCGPDLQRFTTYYSIFQALMYTFCFRWRDLVADELEDDNFEVSELRWGRDVIDIFRRNIYSKLNPLKVCSPIIVSQFARMAQQMEILMLEPKLQQNKRIRLTRSMFSAQSGFSILAERENALSVKSGEEAFQLEGFFPFDPYHLPLSKKWLEADYNEWKPLPIAEVEDVDEEESSDDESDDEDGNEEEEEDE